MINKVFISSSKLSTRLQRKKSKKNAKRVFFHYHAVNLKFAHEKANLKQEKEKLLNSDTESF